MKTRGVDTIASTEDHDRNAGVSGLLREGDVFQLDDGDVVYFTMPWHMAPLSWARPNNDETGLWDTREFVVHVGEKLRNGCSAEFLRGRYVVTGTMLSGGGGDGRGGYVSPGHCVVAVHVEHHHVRVKFYQTGAFTAMLPGKQAVGRATAVWSVTDDEERPMSSTTYGQMGD